MHLIPVHVLYFQVHVLWNFIMHLGALWKHNIVTKENNTSVEPVLVGVLFRLLIMF